MYKDSESLTGGLLSMGLQRVGHMTERNLVAK